MNIYDFIHKIMHIHKYFQKNMQKVLDKAFLWCIIVLCDKNGAVYFISTDQNNGGIYNG